MMKQTLRPRHKLAAAFGALAAALLPGCKSSVPLPPMDPPAASPGPVARAEPGAPAPQAAPRTSAATHAAAYRNEAAAHLYGMNPDRIFKGRLPPMLYAIGTLQVELDRGGNVRNLNWMRAPKHAPEVVAEIERTVRAAQPFPAPVRMGKVVYTETWLWHQSGRFQLHTLTEGQD
jgi:protein TonB